MDAHQFRYHHKSAEWQPIRNPIGASSNIKGIKITHSDNKDNSHAADDMITREPLDIGLERTTSGDTCS